MSPSPTRGKGAIGEILTPEEEVQALAEATKGGFLQTGPGRVDLSPEAPRLFTRGYQLEGLYIPVNVLIKVVDTGANLKLTIVESTVSVRLRRNSSLIWAHEESIAPAANIHLGETEGAPDLFFASFVLADDFNNPIEMGPMDRLGIEFFAAGTARTEEGHEPNGMNVAAALLPGTIRYRIEPPPQIEGG